MRFFRVSSSKDERVFLCLAGSALRAVNHIALQLFGPAQLEGLSVQTKGNTAEMRVAIQGTLYVISARPHLSPAIPQSIPSTLYAHAA
jgi:hypothetical protein